MNEQRPEPLAGLTLEVENFGPIVEASVNLRPLTVFVGPSNTGKSYLAILAYALHKSFPPEYPWRIPRFASRHVEPIQDNTLPRESRDWLVAAQEWLGSDSERSPISLVPKDVENGVRRTLANARGFNHVVERNLVNCFGVDDPCNLIRRIGQHNRASISLKIHRDSEHQSVDSERLSVSYRMNIKSGRHLGIKGEFDLTTPVRIREDTMAHLIRNIIPTQVFSHSENRDSLPDQGVNYLIGEVMNPLFLSVFHPLSSEAFYLPASRTGVMHSHRTVVSALIQGAVAAGRRPTTPVPMLSGVLADFLDDLVALPQSSRRRSMSFRHLRRETRRPQAGLEGHARLLEENLLDGGITLDQGETNYPTFSYQPVGWEGELPLMRTSSMVSELAPVVLYLRHLVQPGDLFIIEEPESHLHPEMQAAFARELARLVHAGVRVLLTTHSEWFLEQIGNLVRLSGLPASERSGIPGEDVALRPEQVGAWLFRPKKRPRGTVVEEIELDAETGLYPAGYDAVSEALYNESAEIFNRGQEGPAE